jgi:hypothetical protein
MNDRPDGSFLRNVAANYAPPPMTATQRTRFDARLEERVRNGVAHPRVWFASVAAAATFAALFFWQSSGVAPTADGVADLGGAGASIEGAATQGDWILAVEGDLVADANAGLPADYVAISSLLLGE